jgi:L-threonylcarbamoyladenylate synthase
MIVLNMDEYNLHKKTIQKELTRSTFIYPHDTIYGIGCDARDEKLVNRIRKIKKSEQPFSIIAPTKEWIYNNCVVSEEAEEWVRKLPGPYTLILKLKNPKAVSKNVYKNENMTLGVRMPNHWFLGVVTQLNIPIVTTSANVKGRDFMTSLDDLDSEIRNRVDYVFYEGPKKGFPSTIVHLEGSKVEIQPRVGRNSREGEIQFPIKEISLNN